jgi:hypothetical protein
LPHKKRKLIVKKKETCTAKDVEKKVGKLGERNRHAYSFSRPEI